MTRKTFIERILRQIYNGQPSDDSSITFNLVNQWLNDAIGVAAKKNYTDSIQMDGVAYVNNSFYTSYSSLTITQVDNTTFKFTLPQIPVALGKNEGIATLQFSNSKTPTSFGAVPLSMNQVGYQDTLRPIQNKVVYWPQGQEVYMSTGIPLTAYKANVRMVSGGDSSDLNSTLIISKAIYGRRCYRGRVIFT
ncbi:hypothetical protein EBU24_00705 [bacterium]|nr:hypothetical protein [bacterium]